MLNRDVDTPVLLRIGLVGLALHGIALMLLNRAGRVSDRLDFALGLLFGVSAGLLLLAAWQNGKKRREGRQATVSRSACELRMGSEGGRPRRPG